MLAGEVPMAETCAVQPETRYARSGDVSIAYQVVGEGPFDVVLVQSFSHVELMWSMSNHHGEIPRRLATFARLIVFDRRGVGMSDRELGESFEERMDDVRAVMDAAGSTRAALFGMLDGAALSVLFAATYPERTSALVLFSSVPRTLWAPDYPAGLTDEQWSVVKQGIMRFFLGSRKPLRLRAASGGVSPATRRSSSTSTTSGAPSGVLKGRRSISTSTGTPTSGACCRLSRRPRC
jgi:pimeloyl-ACP methyl ester carboxylesterase